MVQKLSFKCQCSIFPRISVGLPDCTSLSFPDGQIVINEADMFKSGNDLAAAGGIRSSTATGPSFNPRKNEQASVVIIYRLSTWQLGRSYKLGQLQAEAEAIEKAVHKSFISFEVKFNINQPNPMNHLINELTAFVDIPATATKEDIEQIDWT
jgi:hypothetical protein